MEYQRFCGIIFGSRTWSPPKFICLSEMPVEFALSLFPCHWDRNKTQVQKTMESVWDCRFPTLAFWMYTTLHNTLKKRFNFCKANIIEFKSYLEYLFSLSTRLCIANTGRNKYGCSLALKLQYININCTPIPPKHIYVANLKTFYTAAYC